MCICTPVWKLVSLWWIRKCNSYRIRRLISTPLWSNYDCSTVHCRSEVLMVGSKCRKLRWGGSYEGPYTVGYNALCAKTHFHGLLVIWTLQPFFHNEQCIIISLHLWNQWSSDSDPYVFLHVYTIFYKYSQRLHMNNPLNTLFLRSTFRGISTARCVLYRNLINVASFPMLQLITLYSENRFTHSLRQYEAYLFCLRRNSLLLVGGYNLIGYRCSIITDVKNEICKWIFLVYTQTNTTHVNRNQ